VKESTPLRFAFLLKGGPPRLLNLRGENPSQGEALSLLS